MISPDDLLRRNIIENSALITFDDGYKSFFTNAVPILQDYNLPSINFLNMAPIKGKIFWAGLIVYLCDKCPDFNKYIKSNLKFDKDKKPLFLYCSKKLVNSFLEKTGKILNKEIEQFVGEFSTLEDLQTVKSNKLVFLATIYIIIMSHFYYLSKNF